MVVNAWLVLQVSSPKSIRLSTNTVVFLNFSFIWSLNVVKRRNGYLFLERKMISQKSIISLFSPSISALLNKIDEVLLKSRNGDSQAF